MIFIEYRIHGYKPSDCFRPDPNWGKRTFNLNDAAPELAVLSEQEIIAGCIETAPDGYSLATLKRMGEDHFFYDARRQFPMPVPVKRDDLDD